MIFNRGESFDQTNLRADTVVNAAALHVHQRRVLSSPRQLQQQELIGRHAVFGGRDPELAQLDHWVRASPRRFHFLHAASGFGKTALLANWLRTLPPDGPHVCSHFINRFADMADEEFALANLCEQLASAHDVRDELPPSTGALRAVYQKLLREPLPDERPLIVVIDALDEAKGWTPGPALFPRAAGPHVHFVFSARVDDRVTRDQWLAQLGLGPAEADTFQLGRMEAPAIAALLLKSGPQGAAFAARPGFVANLLAVSQGDPFYVSILVQHLGETSAGERVIAPRDNDLAGFLEHWKRQLFEDADLTRDEIYTLLGVLSAALGPLRPHELAGVSPALQKSLLIEREIGGRLRRHLSGNRESGYALCHPRFREFLGRRAFHADEIARYRADLIAYCGRWREHRDAYALQHYAAHLAEARHTTDLYALIGREWREARQQQAGSLRAFAGDVAAALQVAGRGESEPDVRQALRLGLIFASIKSAIERVPTGLLDAWVRLGLVDAACDCAQLAAQPARRSEAYGVIAGALEAVGEVHRAIEVFSLGVIAAERIAEPDASAVALLHHARALVRLGAREPAGQAATLLVKAAQDATQASTLAELTAFFEANGLVESAGDAAARLQAVRGAGSGFTIDLSGYKSEPSPLDRALAESETFEKAGQVEEARAALGRACTLVRAATPTYDPWSIECDLSARFLRLGCSQEARAAAQRALALTDTESARKGFGSVGLAAEIASVVPALAQAGLVDEAVAAAAAAVNGVSSGNLNAVAHLPGVLAAAGRRAEALALGGRLHDVAATFAADRSQLRALIAIAGSARRDMKQGHVILDGVLRTLETLGDESATAALLPLVAAARARLGATVNPLVRERALADELRPGARHEALAGLVGPYATVGRVADALRCRDQVAAYLKGQPQVYGGPPVGAIAVELARGSIAAGDTAWAMACLAEIREAGTAGNSVPLLLRRATLHVACGQRSEARVIADEVFSMGLRYASMEDLGSTLRTLGVLQEDGRARELLRSALAALQSMPPADEPFGTAFGAIAAGAVDLADDAVLACLRAMAGPISDPRLRLRVWGALAVADLDRGRSDDARAAVAHAWQFEAREDSFWYRSLSSALARVLSVWSRLDDAASVRRMWDWAIEHGLQRPGREQILAELLPALTASVDARRLEEMEAQVRAATEPGTSGAASRNQHLRPRCIHLAAFSQVFFQRGQRERAASLAQESLDVFMAITDGAVTPSVLPFLIPALENAGDTPGLLRLLHMKADKRPYVREWGPMLQRLLPCLARFGVDDPDSKAREALSREKSYQQPALVEFAEAYARRGLDERAAATVTAITSVALRAEAWYKVARAQVERGARGEALASLQVLLQALAAMRSTGPWIADVVSLAHTLAAPPRLIAAFKRAFLKALPSDFLQVDPGWIEEAVETQFETGGLAALERPDAIVAALERPVAAARGSSALLLARARGGLRGEEFTVRLEPALAKVAALADVADQVAPLTMVARACHVAGFTQPAQDAALRALDAARHANRDVFFSTLEATADILGEMISPAEAIRALQEADDVWPVPPGGEARSPMPASVARKRKRSTSGKTGR